MDTDTRPAPEPVPDPDPDTSKASGTPEVLAPRRRGQDESPQPDGRVATAARQDALPFDDESERPVAFALTARGKRVVAPGELPSLAVVGARTASPVRGDGDGAGAPRVGRRRGAPSPDDDWPRHDDPSDTRPSRARALHRAGLSPTTIAEELHVDPLLVRAWTGQAGLGGASAVPGGPSGPPGAGASDARGGSRPEHAPQQETAFELARSAAADRARQTLSSDAGFAAGLGLLVGAAEIDRHAVTVTTMDPAIIAAVMRWLEERLALDTTRVRVVLRVGPAAAGDLTVHRWSRACGLDRRTFAVARWHDAPHRDAVQALLRVADPAVAATVAGWRDALLVPSVSNPADLAF